LRGEKTEALPEKSRRRGQPGWPPGRGRTSAVPSASGRNSLSAPNGTGEPAGTAPSGSGFGSPAGLPVVASTASNWPSSVTASNWFPTQAGAPARPAPFNGQGPSG